MDCMNLAQLLDGVKCCLIQVSEIPYRTKSGKLIKDKGIDKITVI